MKPSPSMQQIVLQLAQRHGVDLTLEGAHLRLTMEGYEPLVIENIGLSRVMVAHFFIHHGDLVPDPSVTFFTGVPSGWIPMGITHSFGASWTYAVVSAAGTHLTCLNRPEQADLAEFTEVWAQNLIDQQWLTHGQRAQPPLFPLGQVVATPGALAALREAGQDPLELLKRHQHGDWGDMLDEDKAENDFSVNKELRIFSAYILSTGVKIWLITEADRSATTFLLPSEY